MKNKIARRLTSYFAVTLLFFALLVGALFSAMFARHTADVTERDLKAHAAAVADAMSQFQAEMHQGVCKGGGFKAFLRFSGDIAMSEMYLLDAQGNAAMQDSITPPTQELTEKAQEILSAVFETGEVVCEAFSTSMFHADNLIAGAPVFDPEGNVLYALLLCAPAGSVSHALRDTISILGACLTIAMALAMLISKFLSYRFVTPLHRMKKATEKLMAGEYDAQTDVRQNDEIGILAAHIDQLALKLADVEEERRQLDKMRKDFFSDVSHELRTPITVLKGSVDLLCGGMIADPEQVQRCYARLKTDVTHIERLVNDLMELTRLQNPRFHLEMDCVNLRDILLDTVRFMTQRAGEKKIHIVFDTCMTPFATFGDYGRLRQLMIILLDNAIKFSPEGAKIELTAEIGEQQCRVCVVDHGIGMDEEMAAQMFERYFHNRTSQNAGGTGLGLPIAKEIALRHGIELSCRSKKGEGTCFTLVFAAWPVDESEWDA